MFLMNFKLTFDVFKDSRKDENRTIMTVFTASGDCKVFSFDELLKENMLFHPADGFWGSEGY